MRNRFTNFESANLLRGLTMCFLMFFVLHVDLNAQCDDTEPPMFNNCAPVNINLESGECGAFINPQISATDDCDNTPISVTLNTANEPIDAGLGCENGSMYVLQMFNAPSVGVFTEYTISDIDLGYFEAMNNAVVEVKVYITDGTMNVSDWELVSTTTDNIVNGTNDYQNININAVIPAGENFAFELVFPNSTIHGDVAGFNSAGQSAPTFYKQPACGIDNYVDVTTVLGAGAGLLLEVNGTAASVHILADPVTGLEVDDMFPAGTYTLSFTAVDALGSSSNCSLSVNINEFANPVSSLTCNDVVNVSLDEDCEVVIMPDEILEGGDYGCFDDMTVTVFSPSGQPLGNMVNGNYVGEILRVEVENSIGNKCWGDLLIEDKSAPVLECNDVYTTCIGDITPGSNLPNTITVRAKTEDSIIGTGLYSNVFEADVFGLTGASINDLDIVFFAKHTNVSQLSATLEGPDGTFINLFTNPGTNCAGDNIAISLDQQAMMTYPELENSCEPTSPSISGRFMPQGSLSAFNGKDPNGTWKITVTDLTAGNGGVIQNISLVFRQSGGKIAFPNDVTSAISSNGGNSYVVDGIDPCGPVEIGYTDKIVEEDCNTIYSQIIERTWNARDLSGNVATPCVQRIYVYRTGLESLTFPENYDGMENPTLSCDVYGTYDDAPNYFPTGAPSGDLCDNIQIFPFEDIVIPICENSYKVIRKWTVLEWCSAEVVTWLQIIKVTDETAPRFVCPNDVTMSTGPLDCDLDYPIEEPEVTDNCSSEVELSLFYYFVEDPANIPANPLFVKAVNNNLPNLPFGRTIIRWVAEDDCGNKGSCEYNVTVEDRSPPVAVCNEFTVAALGSDGTARVKATSFDDFSYDNCEIDRIEALKMTNKCPGGTITEWRDEVVFCCMEVGESVMVRFRVVDKAGNSNTCMVEVKVDDKLPPYITKCPADITLDCFADLDPSNTGEPEAVDNCEIVSINFSPQNFQLDKCGEGEFTRTWTVEDAGGRKDVCFQKITVVNQDPFEYGDIDWPDDYTSKDCGDGLDPDDLDPIYARPRFNDDACSQVAIDYKDQVFSVAGDACVKILREWTVIDWCTFDGVNSDRGIYKELQVLKIKTDKKPVFEDCRNKTFDTFGKCEGLVSDTIEATHDCDAIVLNYTYMIDAFDDGTFDINGTGNNFTRTLPDGIHRVKWTATDGCNNYETCEYLITVKDGKQPTPYCRTSVTTVVMPTSQMIDIWASDFDLGSYDNCTETEDLIIAFNSAGTRTREVFTCDMIVDGDQQYFELEMWVIDEAGNRDFCRVGVVVQDGVEDVCGDQTANLVNLRGEANMVNGEALSDVSMTLTKDNEVLSTIMTDTDGKYEFLNLSKNGTYTIFPEKNVDHMNGVSTRDLVMMQRHILFVDRFTTPYQAVASDVNNDEKITASDLVALRKLILGITNEMPGTQKSWRFVDANQTFNDIAQPFPYNEEMEYTDLVDKENNVPYIAVKIGDVDNSASANITSTATEFRSEETTIIEYETEFINGQFVTSFYPTTDNISGLQAEINFGSVSVEELTTGSIEINETNSRLIDNVLRLSITDEVLSTDALFSITSSEPFNAIALSNDFNNELYDLDLSTSALELVSRNNEDAVMLDLYQNTPNPFTASTNIGFVLPKDANATLTIFDATGRMVYNQTGQFLKGENNITITDSELAATGILYYQLSGEGFKVTKRMIRIAN